MILKIHLVQREEEEEEEGRELGHLHSNAEAENFCAPRAIRVSLVAHNGRCVFLSRKREEEEEDRHARLMGGRRH